MLSSITSCNRPSAGIASIPAVSPAAFISMVLFAVLAAVIIQGPLGLKSAFSGDNPASNGSGASTLKHANSGSLSLTGLLEILSAKLPGFPGALGTAVQTQDNPYHQAVSGPIPLMVGQGSTSNKDGHSQWNWFANPCAYGQIFRLPRTDTRQRSTQYESACRITAGSIPSGIQSHEGDRGFNGRKVSLFPTPTPASE